MNDLTGQKFRRLTALRREGCKGKHAAWLCRCECGNEVVIASNQLRKENGTESCGCAKRQHGESYSCGITPLYNTWLRMRDRCRNPKSLDYKHYGGRGIKVCPEWDSYEQFKLDMGDKPKGRSLDRIDNDGDYCKANCRWATRTEQAANTRVARWIEFNGKRQVLSAWAREFKTNAGQVHYYIAKYGEQAGMAYLLRKGK